MQITDTMIYLTDNGAALCGAHLGSTAKRTGRDISGMTVEPVTPELAANAQRRGWDVSCERCGRKPSLLAASPSYTGGA